MEAVTKSGMDQNVNAVSIPITPFWEKDPKAWFSQFEAILHIRGISSDTTRYFYALSALPLHVIHELGDILNSPQEKSYSQLKEAVIKRVGLSDQQKIRRLLSDVQLGDRKPSQFLQELRSLADASFTDDTFLKEMWLHRLPLSIQSILKVAIDVPLSKLAEMADGIWETQSLGVAQISPVTPYDDLRAQIATLSKQMERMARPSQARSANRRQTGGSRNRSSSRKRKYDGVCWYHFTYKAKALKCHKPCSFHAKPAGNE